MASLSEKELRDSVKEILRNADLSSLSAKKVRKQLEEKHDVDLTDRKKEVDTVVMELVTNGVDSDGPGEDETNKNGADDEISDQSDEEPEFEPPKKKIKPVKKAVKPEPKKTKEIISKPEVDDSDEDDDKDDLDDEKVAQKLQDEENTYRSRSRAAKKPPKPQKVRVKKKEKSTESKGKYGKPCLLSAELADIMGTDKMHRSDIVKRMWEIIRERNLQDPKNKQFMLCDDQLLKVFGKKRVRTFGMMKDLKCHIKDEFAVTS